MIRDKQNLEQDEWKLINMRKVEHLLGAEFIHNLYNRHLPRINSIRFRNTRVEWKDGIVLSYAPKSEWEFLETLVAQRYKMGDPYIIEQTREMMKVDRTHINKLEDDFHEINFFECEIIKLVNTLIDIQDKVLGELYQVNLVQIERALYTAIDQKLKEEGYYEKYGESLLSQLITTDEKTEFQKEEEDFEVIIKKIKEGMLIDEYSILLNAHYKKYSGMHCAYGESPYSLDYYKEKMERSLSNVSLEKQDILKDSNTIDLILDEKLKELIILMREVGTFRDYNKARLGKIVAIKFTIFDAISQRLNIKREDLNFYLLSELLTLLIDKNFVSHQIIYERKQQGIVFIRSEYLCIQETLLPTMQKYEHRTTIKTTCASKGVVSGLARIVLSKEDAKRVLNGDIMIAIGTDFDLMDAIQ